MDLNKSILLAITAATAFGAAAAVPQEFTARQSQAGNRFPAMAANRSWRPSRLPAPTIAPAPGMLNAKGSRAKAKADASLPVINACVVSSYGDWFVKDNKEQIGYYSFQPTANLTFSEVMVHPNLQVNGGGAWVDGKLYYHIWEMYADESSPTGIAFHNYFCTVDTRRWNMLNTIEQHDNQDNIAYDMTVDPASGTLYAVQWGPYEEKWCDFAKVDKETGLSTVIAKIPEQAVIAADNFGLLYTVDRTGTFNYIDKATGELVALGKTGIEPKYIQTATVDPATNTIYWAAMSEKQGGQLYTLDPCTGKATLVARMPDDEELTGMYIEGDRAGLGAPAAVTGVTMTSGNGSTAITATLPLKAFDGTALQGEITTDLYVDGVHAGSAKGAPGSSVSIPATLSDGNHVIVIVPSNGAGTGEKCIRNQWCGKDKPAAVTDLRLEISGHKASLSWTAPAGGLQGGIIDPAQTSYEVKRYPGAVVVATGLKATSFSEELPDAFATYYYEVTASNDMGQGGVATSNAVLVGDALTVPYHQGFDTAESTAGFTILNNEEGRGWYWWNNTTMNYQVMASRFNRNSAADNWMIMPAMRLEKEKEYVLRFSARVFDDESPEKFEVTMGRDASPEAQTVKILNTVTIKNEDAMTYELPFKVAEDGTWNIAFHCVSAAMAYYLLIDDIDVVYSEDVKGEPLPVSDAKAVYKDDKVEVSWTAPTKDVNGKDLNVSELLYRVYDASRGNILADSISATSFEDIRFKGLDLQTFVYYQIQAINGDKISKEALTEFVVTGKDYPLPFGESFKGAGIENRPWALSTLAGNTAGCWTMAAKTSKPAATAQDADEGMAIFRAAELPAGCEARLTSPKINLGGVQNGKLTFWVFMPGKDCKESLSVEISHNDNVFTPVYTVDLTADATGWKEFTLPLPAAQCREQSMVAFRAKSSGYGSDICLDHITVTGENSGIIGIGDLGEENVPMEYYTLQGERISAPTAPGIYIVRSQGKTRKIIVR